jgi:acetyl esterase/lipase
MDLYVPVKKERLNPFVAPLLSENLNDQPNTLLITAEFDPLRDEGDAYGMKLKEFGNSVRAFCIKGAIHGFLGNPLSIDEIKKTHELIKIFLNEPLQEGRVKNERTEEIQME